ncbi:MAG: hypothetical protein RSC43_09390 [Clostridia bacterium]
MEIYKILQDIMLEKSLTIPDVARACGLSDSTVRGIITRKQKSVALEVAFRLSSGLHVTMERLNGDDENKLHDENADVFSKTEVEIIKKYRSLDERGKAAIVDHMERELQFLSDNRMEIITKDIVQTANDAASAVQTLKQNPCGSKK